MKTQYTHGERYTDIEEVKTYEAVYHLAVVLSL